MPEMMKLLQMLFLKEYLDEIIKYDKPSSIEKLCYLSAKSIIDKKMNQILWHDPMKTYLVLIHLITCLANLL
ncbi:hypothetical protein CYANOKiyG1_05080 [Okeania sp. KiyG1]|nr:hypothetical protein CYANOKiyG1_05080 [Okeania sp. KiyG1]